MLSMLKNSVTKKTATQKEALKTFEETGVLPRSAEIRSIIEILPDFKHKRVIIKGNVKKLFIKGGDLTSLEIKKGASIRCIDICDKGQIRALIIHGEVDYLKAYGGGKILTARICPEGFLGGVASEDPVTIMQLFLQGVKVFVRRDIIEKEFGHVRF